MPGDLWTGYLQAEAADVAEQEREEGKKKQRLEEQLQKLNMEGLRRTIDRDAREWEIEEAGRAGREEMLSGLRDFFGEEPVNAALMGLSGLGGKKEQEPWFIGTPHEERGLGKEFHIKPEKGAAGPDKWEYVKSLTAKDPADLSEEEERYLIGQGLRYDKKLNAWTKPKAKAGMSSFEKDIGFSLDDLGGEGGKTQTADAPKNREELWQSFKGYGKINDPAALKADLDWVTDEDIKWVNRQLKKK